MADECHGNGPEPCCYLPGGVHPIFGMGVCPFLEVDTVPGRRWVCGLRRELGSWDAVHVDDRYMAVVRPVWLANDPPVADCGDFGPCEEQCCYSVTSVEVV